MFISSMNYEYRVNHLIVTDIIDKGIRYRERAAGKANIVRHLLTTFD